MLNVAVYEKYNLFKNFKFSL